MARRYLLRSLKSFSINQTRASETMLPTRLGKLQPFVNRQLLSALLFTAVGVCGIIFLSLNALAAEGSLQDLINEKPIRRKNPFRRRKVLTREEVYRVKIPRIIDEKQLTKQKDVNELIERFHDGNTCVNGWRSLACYSEIINSALSRHADGTVVMVVASRGTFQYILNWCISMELLGLRNYFLVALDKETFTFFDDKNAPVVQLPRTPGEHAIHKSDVWIRRTFASYAILRSGINVLVSDGDAIMVRSPFSDGPSQFFDNSIDIISSPSNFPNPERGELPPACPAPPENGLEWRHQPCMGWILFRASSRMIRFFQDMLLPDVVVFEDDQIGFSCAIRKAGAIWRDSKKWNQNKVMVTGFVSPRLKLAVLPSANFVRNCTESKEERNKGYGIPTFDPKQVYLYHCKGHNKKATAENNGVWFLRDRWDLEAKKTFSDFRSFLTSISTVTRAGAPM